MKFRKFVIFLLCGIMAFSLTACSKHIADDGEGGDGSIHTVTFNVGTDAAAAGVANPKSLEILDGDKMGDKYPIPTWTDHGFGGWYNGNTAVTADTPIKSDLDLIARWKTQEEMDEEAAAYEEHISDWDEAGHLYIHYKRYDHQPSDVGKKNSGAPNYSSAISSDTYKDWGAWVWPKGDNGRLFNAARIDESGAVYDILLDNTYHDAGWDGTNKRSLDKDMTYADAKVVGFQLHSIKSRTEGSGFWANDGGDNDLKLEDIKREKGSYHWFVNQGNVGKGSKRFTNEKIVDPYKDLETGAVATRISGKDIINSATTSTYAKVNNRAAGWDEDAVGYQIFIASFADSNNDGIGDIRGIINKLDYLKSLNVDVLWLTPFQSSTNYHGYDIKDYFSVDPRFGTLSDYRELVYKVHQNGMKIVMDFVLNHTSKSNPWFVKSQNLVVESKETGEVLAKDPLDGTAIDYRQFYTWITKAKYKTLSATEQKQWFGPLNGNGKEEDGYYFYSSFSSDMPELNYDYQPVRDAVVDVCNYWMAFGLDGFRLDAVKHIYMEKEVKGCGKTPSSDIQEDNNTLYNVDRARNFNFYREFNYKLKKNYPNAFLVGENLDGDPARTAEYYQGIDSQFNFNFYYDVSRGVAQASGIPKLSCTINSDGSISGGNAGTPGCLYGGLTAYGSCKEKFTPYNANYIDGQFTSNHDLPRARDRMNISGTNAKYDDAYYGFYSDGTMDGSKGGNLDATRVANTDKMLRLYYSYLMTFPGICWIYYGDEIGMSGLMNYTLKSGSTSSTDSEPHEDRVYRQPMKWKASNNASFKIGYDEYKCELVGLNATSSLKSVEEQSDDKNSLLNWMRLLGKIRDDKGLGKSTLTKDNEAGDGKVIYTVQGTKGKVKVYIFAGGYTLPSATPLSYTIDGKQMSAKYTTSVNGVNMGVLITAA